MTTFLWAYTSSLGSFRHGRTALFLALLLVAAPGWLATPLTADDAIAENSPPPALSSAARETPAEGHVFLPMLTVGTQNQEQTTLRAASQAPTRKILIDTDPGVDDAAALVWLLSQQIYPVEVLGIVTVAGNTDVNNATNNVLTLLDILGQPDIPVVVGAASPLVRTLTRTTMLIHGPDGLWFLGLQNPHDLSTLPTDAAAFYCDTVAANPGATLLILGPMTNVAQAISLCPATMQQLGEVVALGGARIGGNSTPVAEFNIWQDPEAAAQVMAAGLSFTLVPLDAFSQATVRASDLNKLATKGVPAAQFLIPALTQYLAVQEVNGVTPSLPDVVAAIFTLDSSHGLTRPALTKIVADSVLARGQTIMGFEVAQKIPMIASDEELSDIAIQVFSDPTFDIGAALFAILVREPDNTQVVTKVTSKMLLKTFERGLTR